DEGGAGAGGQDPRFMAAGDVEFEVEAIATGSNGDRAGDNARLAGGERLAAPPGDAGEQGVAVGAARGGKPLHVVGRLRRLGHLRPTGEEEEEKTGRDAHAGLDGVARRPGVDGPAEDVRPSERGSYSCVSARWPSRERRVLQSAG